MKNLILFLLPFGLFAQENCNYYKTIGEMDKYEACVMYEELAIKYPNQFQREWMEGLDSILAKNPTYARALHEKSVTYLKAGNFVKWKKIIDKAVKSDAVNYLGYRAGAKAKFLADYEGAIQDIDSLATITNYDLGVTINGDYHLNIVKAICYSQLGQKEKAIEVFEKQLANPEHNVGLYDYYQLGVTYFELNQYDKALKSFERQIQENENAETQYYIGQIYKAQNDSENYKKHKEKALELYEKGVIMRDPYNEHINKVYYETIAEN